MPKFRTALERILIEHKLSNAWFQVHDRVPFSPAWEAAMAEVEDLERVLWHQLRQPPVATPEPSFAAD